MTWYCDFAIVIYLGCCSFGFCSLCISGFVMCCVGWCLLGVVRLCRFGLIAWIDVVCCCFGIVRVALVG